MPQYHQFPSDKKQPTYSIEWPIPRGFAPCVLTGEHLMLTPLLPEHRYKLHEEIFSQPQVMKFFGAGKYFTLNAYTAIHMTRAKQNLKLQYDNDTGCLSHFTWTIITHDGIAGRINIFPSEGRTELAFCVSPRQKGRALARRASELVIEYMGDESSFIATAHPLNIASSKTLERIRYQDGQTVFFRDPGRQNVLNKYGKNQSRDYFLSRKKNLFFF